MEKWRIYNSNFYVFHQIDLEIIKSDKFPEINSHEYLWRLSKQQLKHR